MHWVVRGGIAGLVATVTMTAVIAAGRAAGLLRTPPPAEITARAAAKARVGPSRRLAEQAGWLVAHAGYGAVCGVGYALVRPVVPLPGPAVGVAYGGAVWAASYLGLMPALGLYPQPEDDSRSRQAVMIAAHAVFGLTLAEADRGLAGR